MQNDLPITKIIKIDDVASQETKLALKTASDILRKGGLVAFPTETVYGLGANGLDVRACRRIYEAKGRPSDNPIILHVADRAMLSSLVAEVTPLAEKLIAAFCPGPLTLIMRRSSIVPSEVTGGLDTVGIRMPRNAIALAMIRAANIPIAAPSANLSGRPSPTTAAAVYCDLAGRIPLILDGGACIFGLESTIVDCTSNKAIILRPGAITKEMLLKITDKVELDSALLGKSDTPRAPGMKYRHYSPKMPVTLFEPCGGDVAQTMLLEMQKLQARGKTVGALVSSEVLNKLGEAISPDYAVSYGRRGDDVAIAAKLYQALLYFDTLPIDNLLVEGTSEKGLGLAIMNRLRKASGGHSIYVKT